jgi:hypothetical protein
MVYSWVIMTPDPQEVLDLAKQLVEAKATLDELTRKWEKIFSHSDSSPQPAKEKRTDSFAAKVRGVLAKEPGRVFTIGQVADLAEGDTLKVGRTLFRLANTGHVENAGRGLYRAPSAEVTH